MSTTDQRTGFRLPWSTEGRPRDSETDADSADGATAPEAAAEATDATEAATDVTEAPTDVAADATDVGEGPTDAAADAIDVGEAAAGGDLPNDMTWPEVDRRVRQLGRRANDTADAAMAEITAGTPPLARRTNALMAGLSKAMHAAAESARVETLERLAADATARTEAIKAAAADEAAAIKQAAERDIAGVRDWSKSELARVREETEGQIAARREALERETEAHVARVDARVERVKRVVAAFEATMAEFFTALLAESNPARVALLAEQLPEAPSLEVDDELEAAFEAFEAAADAADIVADTETNTTTNAIEASEDELIGDTPADEATVEVIGEASIEADFGSPVDAGVVEAEVDSETAAAKAEADAEVDSETAAAEAEAEAFAAAVDEPVADGEADAQAATNDLSEEDLAARLAKMDSADAAAGEVAKTQLVVSGLVSVAGIAGFKRAITRISGVSAVGVTSGPGGEFVFSVTHDPETDFPATIAALPGFSARVTGEADGSLQITASDHNPDS